MKRMLSLIIVLSLMSLESLAEGSDTKTAADSKSKSKPISLFNGKDFDGWHMYLKDAQVDPKTVWKVQDGAIWCKGEPLGYLRTTKKYENFKLTVEWRWPETPTNSGVLLRINGEDKDFPLCMEAQLKHQRAGDVVGMGCDFKENKRPAGEFFRHAPRQHDTNEKKAGAWNTYEIICKGDTMELRVNGLLQNTATGIDLPAGYIGLQSEGSPIMFKNIKLTPLP
jgi:hypothetical protein